RRAGSPMMSAPGRSGRSLAHLLSAPGRSGRSLAHLLSAPGRSGRSLAHLPTLPLGFGTLPLGFESRTDLGRQYASAVALLLVLLVVVPVIELSGFIQVSNAIGFLNALGIVILISIFGCWLVKR